MFFIPVFMEHSPSGAREYSGMQLKLNLLTKLTLASMMIRVLAVWKKRVCQKIAAAMVNTKMAMANIDFLFNFLIDI